jgi:L-rhamnose isomerase
MTSQIEKNFEHANKQYQELGVDPNKAMEILKEISISIHCWQGDDVGGFEKPGAKLSGGGIQVTGNYLGKARTIDELQSDLLKAVSLIPGSHRINLQASYGDFGKKFVERDEITIEHYQNWIDWSKRNNLKLDFNSTLFSHPKANDGFTLSNNSKKIREFWIEHVLRCRKISSEIGKQLNDSCIHNLWIPDGSKDIPVDRAGRRLLLKNSLDEIYSDKFPASHMKDSLEGKLFGLGSEAFVVGSHYFYLSYAIKNGIMLTLDTGHFHPTESVADKVSAILPFISGIVFHISRGIRWDSDHVVILNDQIIQIAEEIIRSKSLDKIHIMLDFFDASINRVGAWVIGARATLKSLLYALLQPWDLLLKYERENKYFQRLAYLEELKTLPFGSIWDYYCLKNDVPVSTKWIESIEDYEKEVLSKRV